MGNDGFGGGLSLEDIQALANGRVNPNEIFGNNQNTSNTSNNYNKKQDDVSNLEQSNEVNEANEDASLNTEYNSTDEAVNSSEPPVDEVLSSTEPPLDETLSSTEEPLLDDLLKNDDNTNLEDNLGLSDFPDVSSEDLAQISDLSGIDDLGDISDFSDVTPIDNQPNNDDISEITADTTLEDGFVDADANNYNSDFTPQSDVTFDSTENNDNFEEITQTDNNNNDFQNIEPEIKETKEEINTKGDDFNMGDNFEVKDAKFEPKSRKEIIDFSVGSLLKYVKFNEILDSLLDYGISREVIVADLIKDMEPDNVMVLMSKAFIVKKDNNK